MVSEKQCLSRKLHIPLKGFAVFRLFWRWIRQTLLSTLTRQIVFLNLIGLIVLSGGFLYLNQFRAGLIDARIQSLITQGEIIAGAISSAATLDTDTILIDPNSLWELESGESSSLTEDFMTSLEFSINPERVAPVLLKLVTPTRTRARVYDRDGFLLIDSHALFSLGDIIKKDLSPPGKKETKWIQEIGRWYRSHFKSSTTPLLDIGPAIGSNLPEVQTALKGQRINAVRINQDGDTIVSVAVPIQRQKSTRGALLLSTQSGDIDGIIAGERMAIIRIFLVAAFVMLVVSMFFARSIVLPVRKLAEAAEKVQKGSKSANTIPDFSGRFDEIEHLSSALRNMTAALFDRIEAIEHFAADVAHELKNPLTSVRSAVETLPLAKSEESRKRLLDVIQHDIRRLDRLITDISEASRLDAELARGSVEPIDLKKLLQAVVAISNDRKRPEDAEITLTVEELKKNHQQRGFEILGHDTRLAQVINNLLDNARSFSPKGKTVDVFLKKKNSWIEIIVEDSGPGIPGFALERIFERFYTDRPEEQGFGQNSGLGLAISKQIVEAHKGTITAENRYNDVDIKTSSDEEKEERHPAGARFIVQLPVRVTPKNSSRKDKTNN